MKICAISDTHTFHNKFTIPACDVLIHAGDFSNRGEPFEIQRFSMWLAAQKAPHKIFICGNHDGFIAEKTPARFRDLISSNVIYLEGSEATIGGLKFFGFPWQPRFFDWAFNVDRNSAEMIRLVRNIPKDVNVLISHGPPFGILDTSYKNSESLGCEIMRNELSNFKELKLMVFGHIHGGRGTKVVDKTTFANVSICNERYDPVNPPMVFEVNP